MAASSGDAFRPISNSTIVFAANTTGRQIPNAPITGSYQIRIRNKGTAEVYVNFANNNTAVVTVPAGNNTGDLGFNPSSIEVVTVSGSYVSLSSTANVNVEMTPGYGL